MRRILFVLHEPGYFRLYGSTIIELARRGWEVLLAYDKPHKRGGHLLVPAGAGGNVRSLGALGALDVGAPSIATMLRTGLDYVRYLEPAFANAGYLRRRAEKNLPKTLNVFARVRSLPRWAVSAAIGTARLAEHLIPITRTTREFLQRVRPAVIVISPGVILGKSGAHQTELIKAGRKLGVPVIVGVASWDHLTSKGLLRVIPDAITVWNDVQVREAVELHRVPRSRVIVTGAQSLDHWFEPPAPGAAEAFRQRLGIDPHRRVLLLVGSSKGMAPGDSEVQFVRRWLAAIRASGVDAVRDAFVIIRPHPGNTEQWRDVELADAHATVYPQEYSGLPLSDLEVETFRHSMLVSTAVVGINTTAMIEAAILRRPVFTIRDAAFNHSQQETLHFTYLLSTQGGCVESADTLSEHVVALERVLATENSNLETADRFVERFVRPRGVRESATTHLCDAIERMATGRRVGWRARETLRPGFAEDPRLTPSGIRDNNR